MASVKSIAMREAKVKEAMEQRMAAIEAKLDQLLEDAQEELGLLDRICDHLGIEVTEDGDHKS